MTFQTCVEECLKAPEFIQQYKRLTGASLGSGKPIERMIDESTGLMEKEYFDLFNFIRDYIYLPVIAKTP